MDAYVNGQSTQMSLLKSMPGAQRMLTVAKPGERHSAHGRLESRQTASEGASQLLDPQ